MAGLILRGGGGTERTQRPWTVVVAEGSIGTCSYHLVVVLIDTIYIGMAFALCITACADLEVVS